MLNSSSARSSTTPLICHFWSHFCLLKRRLAGPLRVTEFSASAFHIWGSKAWVDPDLPHFIILITGSGPRFFSLSLRSWATFFRRHAGILQLTCTHSSRGSAARTIIDLLTNTAAILSLLDLRSIMGCPGGALAHYLRGLFGQKEDFNAYFSEKRRSLLQPKTAQWSFFLITFFSRKT